MTLRDDNLRFSLLSTLAGAIAEELKGEREKHESVLFERYAEEGQRNYDVLLPDRTKVGTITLTGGTASYDVADDAVFLDWAREYAPRMVKETVIPATAEQTIYSVIPSARAALLKRCEFDAEAGVIVDTQSGLVVEGVQYTPAGHPTGFQTRITTEGKAQLIDLYRTGALNELTTGSVAAIESSDEEVPPWES